MSEKRKEEIQKEEYFNNKIEDIDEDKILLSQPEKEDINFESINFNINPFKIENSNYEKNNIVKHDDSTIKGKESNYNNIEYNNNIVIGKKNKASVEHPKNINNNLKKQEISPYIDYNIKKSIELNQKKFNINNEKLNYLAPLSLKNNNESNSKFTLKDNKSTENIFNYNFDINRNKNTISNANLFTHFPFYSERINCNPSIINNYNLISSINNKNIKYNNNYNNNNYIKREVPSWDFFSCNNSNNVGKKLFYI